MITRLTAQIFVIILCCGSLSPMASASCDLMMAKKKYSSYIIGFGEGSSYDDAKTRAMADSGQIFGVDVSSEVTLHETNQEVSLQGKTKSNIYHESKGAEILETCGIDGTSYKVIIGVKKSILRSLLEDRARLRVKTAASGDLTRHQVKQYQELEAKDRQNWIVLGLALSEFPLASYQTSKKAVGPFLIKTGDDVAQKTLPLLMARLKREGIMVGTSGNELVWSCQTNPGSPVANVVRFEVRCVLDEDLLPIIEAKGMARIGEDEQQAVRLIGNQLINQILAH